MPDEWIWISRWEDFQHYKPERDRGPAWIKDYTKQLNDRRYLDLTDRQRALLGDLRRIFAVTFGWLPRDSRVISRHRHRQTFRSDIEALNHAGFIEFYSRETLERHLEWLYSPRARSREVEKEVEREPLPREVSLSSTRSDETDAAAPALNGRAALDTPDNDDIPITPQRTTPTFPCNQCDQTFTDWDTRTTHLALDHITQEAR